MNIIFSSSTMFIFNNIITIIIIIITKAQSTPTAERIDNFQPYFFAENNKENPMFKCNKMPSTSSPTVGSTLPPRCHQKSYVGSFFNNNNNVINITSEKQQTKEYLKAYHEALQDGFTVEEIEQQTTPHIPLLDERKILNGIDDATVHDLGCEILTASINNILKSSQQQNGEGLTILDVGCGFGGFIKCVIKKFPKSIKSVIGISLSPSELTVAKQIIKDTKTITNENKKKITFKLLDLNKLENHFKPNTFDLIFNRESFIYAKDPYKYLKAVYKLLKPNGKLRMIAGMLRREKLTYSEGRSLAEDYVNKKMMGNENPCCILSIQQLQSNFDEIGFKNTMVNDLAPYMRPALENILASYFEKKAGTKLEEPEDAKDRFFVKLARGVLDGYESLFFVNGDKILGDAGGSGDNIDNNKKKNMPRNNNRNGRVGKNNQNFLLRGGS